MCNGIVFQCFGVFWAIYRVVLGCLIRDVLYKLGQSHGTRQIFKFRASSTIFNSEIHCLHGLEELVSNNVTRVEIPPLYTRSSTISIHESQTVVNSAEVNEYSL